MIDISSWSQKKKLIALGAALILLVGGGFFFRNLKNDKNNSLDLPRVNVGGAEITVEGKFTCIPYMAPIPKDPKCVLGLSTDLGVIYGLDTSSAVGIPSDVTPEDKIFISGILVPLDQIPGEEWKRFAIVGVIRVEKIFEAATEEPEPPFTGPLQNG